MQLYKSEQHPHLVFLILEVGEDVSLWSHMMYFNFVNIIYKKPAGNRLTIIQQTLVNELMSLRHLSHRSSYSSVWYSRYVEQNYDYRRSRLLGSVNSLGVITIALQRSLITEWKNQLVHPEVVNEALYEQFDIPRNDKYTEFWRMLYGDLDNLIEYPRSTIRNAFPGWFLTVPKDVKEFNVYASRVLGEIISNKNSARNIYSVKLPTLALFERYWG